MHKRKKRIAVLMGGVSAEHEVSLGSGDMVVRALDKRRYDAYPIVIEKSGKWKLPRARTLCATGEAIEKIKSEIRADVAFLALHGTHGEDGTIQGLLEFAGIPYTGSGVLASALAMDKVRSSELFSSRGINVPAYVTMVKGTAPRLRNSFGFPCVVKPSRCGSSVGVAVVRTPRELVRAVKRAFSYDRVVLVQKYIKGTEVTCGVLDKGGARKPIALPPTEIVPKSSKFFDYRAKYAPGASEEVTPPRLPKRTIAKIQSAALKAHEILGCAGMSRTDMFVAHGEVYVLETNTIPGMTATSLYPQEARAAGISFSRLMDILIRAALTRAS